MTTGSLKIVLTPDALGEALMDPTSQRLLLAWRDGRLQLVVSRSLLLRYFRLLRRLALPERLLRWWGFWLASPRKVLLVADPPTVDSLPELCVALSRSAGFVHVVTGQRAPAAPVSDSTAPEAPPWVTLPELIAREAL
jgi:hypothetical protein